MKEKMAIRYLELDEVAEMLNVDTDEFIDWLKRKEYLSGNTQSLKAFKMKLFYVNEGVQRWKGGLYHHSRFHIRVKPNGVAFFLREFSPNEVI